MGVLNMTELKAILAGNSVDALLAAHGAVGKLDAGKLDAAAVGVANGAASLGPDGRVPPGQIDFTGVEEVIPLIAIQDTEPAALDVGNRYFNTATNQIYTWDGDYWVDGAPPSGNKFYVCGGVFHTWDGTDMSAFIQGAPRATAFSAADAWADNGDGTFSLALDIGVSGPVDVGATFDQTGAVQLANVTRALSAGNTILTIRAFKAFSGEICWAQIS